MNDFEGWHVVRYGIMVAIGVLAWLMAWRQRRANRREAERRAAAGIAPTKTPTWVWIFFIAMVALFSYLQSASPRRGPGGAMGPSLSILVVGVGLAVIGALLLLVAALYARAWLHPYNRANRLVARERYDEATALVHARMARRRPGPPAAGPDTNPYEAPGASASPAGRQDEANDWNALGTIAMARRDWPEALVCFERAEAIGSPSAYVFRSNRGLVLIDTGRLEEGVALVERAIAEVPDADPWGRALLGLLLAERLVERGLLGLAAPIIDRAERDRRVAPVVPRSAARDFDARLAMARARFAQPLAAPTTGGSPG